MKLILENVHGYEWADDTRTMVLQIDDKLAARLRDQLNDADDFKHKPLIDKAIEDVIERLIRERIEAQVKLRTLELEGFKCSACGTTTRRYER